MDWQNTSYNGLVEEKRVTPKVATGNITKPMVEAQLSERMAPTLEVFSNNDRNRGLLSRKKQRFSIHRAVSFLPQE